VSYQAIGDERHRRLVDMAAKMNSSQFSAQARTCFHCHSVYATVAEADECEIACEEEKDRERHASHAQESTPVAEE
jgi:hypothetical protein